QYQDLRAATEAPVTDTSCTALMLLAGKVREQGFKVALTGEGSDEWLAGYPWYKFQSVLDSLRNMSGGRLNGGAYKFLHKWLDCGDDAVAYMKQGIVSSGGPHAFQRFYDLLSPSRFRFYSQGMRDDLADYDHYAAIEPDLEKAQRLHPINRAIYWAGKIHLPGQLLSLKGDRIAMSQSVEMRYPFLDNDVFDFLAKLDPHLKFRRMTEKY